MSDITADLEHGETYDHWKQTEATISNIMELLQSMSQSLDEDRGAREGRWKKEDERTQRYTMRCDELRSQLESVRARQEGERTLRERESAVSAASKTRLIEEVRQASEEVIEEIQIFFRERRSEAEENHSRLLFAIQGMRGGRSV